MKRLLLVLLLLPLMLVAQQSSSLQEENTRLKNRIDSLEKRMDEKFYTRVPNTDFDRTLQDMVDKQVGNYISGKIALTSTVIGLISFLLGFLAKYFFSESTRKQIDNSVSDLSRKVREDNLESKEKLDVLLSEQKDFINSSTKLFDERIKDIGLRLDNFRSILDNQIQQFNSTITKRIVDFEGTTLTRIKQFEEILNKNTSDLFTAIQSQENSRNSFEKTITSRLDTKFSETLDFLWADVISAMIDRAAAKKYEGDDLINSFEKLLQTELNVSKGLKIQIIDTLMRCYYSSNNEKEKYEKMVQLIQNYENKYDLLPQTYVNAAIAHTNIFEKYGTPELKETSLSNCDKAIKKEPSYGEPYALKLEIFMIDLFRMRDDQHKSAVRKEIQDFLFLINSIESPLLKGYFLERLITDGSVPYLQKYIKAINEDYAHELAPIYENVLQALYENYSIATDREKELMKDILTQGLNSNPNIDGVWEGETYQHSGVGIDLTGTTITLTLQSSSFELGLMNTHSAGLVYYLPHIQPYCINLLWADEKSKFQIVRGIYQIQNPDKILLCISDADQPRPAEFTSNAENGYSILLLNKVQKIDDQEV